MDNLTNVIDMRKSIANYNRPVNKIME